MYRYRIGDIDFWWKESDFQLQQDEYMKRFQVSESEISESQIICESHVSSLEKYKSDKLLIENETYELYQTQKGNLIIYHWAHCRFGFGYWLEDLEKENLMRYYFHPEMKNQIPLSAVRFFSCSGMHSKLLQHDALVLHASYINYKGKAILFIAPSRTGKSTQAQLWNQYAEAEIINGDRALIKKRNDVWHSYGYPCCGSSKICKNCTLPIRAIVLLEQGEENCIEEISESQKIRSLVSGTEVFRWNQFEIERAFSLAKDLVDHVSIIKLICRPEKEAVEVLKKYLGE